MEQLTAPFCISTHLYYFKAFLNFTTHTIIETPRMNIHNPITPFIIKIVNKLFSAKKSPRRINHNPAINTQYRLLNFNFLILKLSINKSIHLIISNIHTRTIKILIISSPDWGKNASKTHTRIWNIDKPAKIHLSSNSLSSIANTTHAIPDKIDSIQKVIIIVSKAKSGLNIITHPKMM